MDSDQAESVVRSAVLGIVPDADLDELGADEDLCDALELDSLDFLAFVETLTSRTGVRLDEDDYPRLRTLRGAAELIVQRS
ncbi:MAG: acyl carrier protein [Actinomycetota bacterium]